MKKRQPQKMTRRKRSVPESQQASQDCDVIVSEAARAWRPAETLVEYDGVKVGDQRWFTYRGEPNCFGKVTTIYPASERDPVTVTLYDQAIHYMFVTVPMSDVRSDTGFVKKPRRKDVRSLRAQRLLRIEDDENG